VTILFCDVIDSTPLTAERDPEALRRIMSRYFEETSAVLRRHGGTVEKYIGDAVMAVFGIPRVHEDDALRALRAAHELRGAVAALNEELEQSWGVRIAIRVGVDTGEVVAGDPSAGQAFVTGEAVILAQRLESAAGAGEVMVGDATLRLARDAVVAEEVGPLSLKGKTEPVKAWRLVDVLEGAPPFERRLDAPLVDRTEELARLREIFEQTVRERVCQVCTLLGTAGIGKSRLASELLRELGERATALSGRCLAYGEGITFWPLAEIVREIGGEEGLAQVLAGRDDASLIIDRIQAVVGRSTAASRSEEIFWAVRKLFESLASRRPVVICLEDIHWAEPTLLDLIEYLAGWIRDAPILLLCLARQEFLDEQPGWLRGQANASALRLDPLSGPDADLLLDELHAETVLSANTRARIADAAEGNPLYLEQMAALAAEGANGNGNRNGNGNGNGGLHVPRTIQTLLAARLDRLDLTERAVIERAAVVGKEFWRGAVLELTPERERPEVGAILLGLVRKELVRPGRSVFVQDDAFSFRHVLIRDAAYAAIPKELRADLHERFAAWIEQNAEEPRGELEEIVGYHLEQAHRFLRELGGADERVVVLAASGAARLAAAGRRALMRDDARAAISLLTRATILLSKDDRGRLALAPDLGAALIEAGELAQADAVLSRAVAAAAGLDEPGVQAHARLLHLELQLFTESEEKTDEIRREAERLIPLLDKLGDDLGLARSWYLLAQAHWTELQASATARALERALEHSHEAGSGRVQNRALTFLTTTIVHGPTPVSEGLRRCEAVLSEGKASRTVESAALRARARLLAMRGGFEEARTLMAQGRAMLGELGLTLDDAASAEGAAFIEILAGDPAAAETLLLPACAKLEEIGNRGYLSLLTAYLAEAAFLQGRYEDAHRGTEISQQAAAPDDRGSHVVWRMVRARVLARPGQTDRAELFAREAVSLAEQTDFLNLRADALVALADVLRKRGVADEARQAAREALRLYEEKGNVVSAGRVARLFASRGS
jgi:class 3 adenylate cyclase/tetratricopeptide (TPR) repeat protein